MPPRVTGNSLSLIELMSDIGLGSGFHLKEISRANGSTIVKGNANSPFSEVVEVGPTIFSSEQFHRFALLVGNGEPEVLRVSRAAA